MSQLSYQIPDNGRKKTLLRIPESHTLYLCPGSCGRRQGIRALKNGEADHASFLTFSQADIALGDYIGMVHDAVDEVLDAIVRMFMEENKSVNEIIRNGYSQIVVERIVRLMRINEYKRRQAPIGIRITPRGFGRDWRCPITSKFRD